MATMVEEGVFQDCLGEQPSVQGMDIGVAKHPGFGTASGIIVTEDGTQVYPAVTVN